MAVSIFSTVLAELQMTQNHNASIERCKVILKEAEALANKRIISYFASEVGTDNNSMVNDEDAFIIENLLSTPSEKKDLLLILHSNGGFSISAERTIDICRSYCERRGDGSTFTVLVPKRAKSAATIISLGADKIYLRDSAELGPVDPQFSVKDKDGNTQFMPAYLQVDALENILKSPGPFSLQNLLALFQPSTPAFTYLSNKTKLKLVDQCNYPLYVNAKNELGLSDSIIDKIAEKKAATNVKISADCFNIFKDPHVTKSHGRLINLGDLQDNSLYVEKIICNASDLFPNDAPKYKTFDSLIWELYVRKRQLLNDAGNKIVKNIESSDEFFLNFGGKLGHTA